MIPARYHWLAEKAWDAYIAWMIRRDFERVEEVWEGDVRPLQARPSLSRPGESRPILLLANHCSWWDGFWLYDLNRRRLGKRFHVMMLEEQLRTRGPLRYAGAYSIDRASARGMVESLAYTAQLLQHPGNLALLFPQGIIESGSVARPAFQKGAWRVLEQLEAPVQVLCAISRTDYFAARRPTLTLYMSEIPEAERATFPQLRDAFQRAYAHALEQQGKRAV
jgi:1-acyl-sn-glycerol-3-phosphate acyltransferase